MEKVTSSDLVFDLTLLISEQCNDKEIAAKVHKLATQIRALAISETADAIISSATHQKKQVSHHLKINQ